MVNSRQEIVLATGSRQRGAELGVCHGAANRDDSADGPEHQQNEAGANVQQLKTKAREYAGANHVGNDDGNDGRKTELSHALVGPLGR